MRKRREEGREKRGRARLLQARPQLLRQCKQRGAVRLGRLGCAAGQRLDDGGAARRRRDRRAQRPGRSTRVCVLLLVLDAGGGCEKRQTGWRRDKRARLPEILWPQRGRRLPLQPQRLPLLLQRGLRVGRLLRARRGGEGGRRVSRRAATPRPPAAPRSLGRRSTPPCACPTRRAAARPPPPSRPPPPPPPAAAASWRAQPPTRAS